MAQGGPSDPLPGAPPRVIDARTVPKDATVGVPVTVFPQLTFSEPVTSVAGRVTLQDAAGENADVVLFGTTREGAVIAVESDSAVVTGLTIQPRAPLKYDTRYTLTLADGIVDSYDGSDGSAARQPPGAYTTSFTTFGPTALGTTTENSASGGLALPVGHAHRSNRKGSAATRARASREVPLQRRDS